MGQRAERKAAKPTDAYRMTIPYEAIRKYEYSLWGKTGNGKHPKAGSNPVCPFHIQTILVTSTIWSIIENEKQKKYNG